MSSRLKSRQDEGFTLVELLIAMVIMGTAVAAIVTAMGGLVLATDQHRGLAQDETAAQAYAQSMLSKFNFATTLTAQANIGDGSICIANDPKFFLTKDVSTMYVTIDQETLAVTGLGNPTTCSPSGYRLAVNRAQGGTVEAQHLVKSQVHQFFVCPGATAASVGIGAYGYVDPDSSAAYAPAAGSGLSVAPTLVEYWDPVSLKFSKAQASCVSDFQTRCKDVDNKAGYDLLPACDTGLVRVTITVTDINAADGASKTASNCSTGAVCTTTQVLLRRGSG